MWSDVITCYVKMIFEKTGDKKSHVGYQDYLTEKVISF
jgi:hypothetical protein